MHAHTLLCAEKSNNTMEQTILSWEYLQVHRRLIEGLIIADEEYCMMLHYNMKAQYNCWYVTYLDYAMPLYPLKEQRK